MTTATAIITLSHGDDSYFGGWYSQLSSSIVVSCTFNSWNKDRSFPNLILISVVYNLKIKNGANISPLFRYSLNINNELTVFLSRKKKKGKKK